MAGPTFIAEISSNHNGDLGRAKEAIAVAADCGFSAVKFQIFEVEKLFAPEILHASAAHRSRSAWELPDHFIPELSDCARQNQLSFGVTPFHLEVIQRVKGLVDFFKIASYELLWEPLFEEVASSDLPIIFSTGMASEEEVVSAANWLSSHGASDVVALHCVSNYPSSMEDSNLSAISSMRQRLGLPVGWSDHSRDPAVIFRAVHRWGAEVVELHFDLDGKGYEAGAGHCWLPEESANVIGLVSRGLTADGDGVKRPTGSENEERLWRSDPSDGLRPISQYRNRFAAQLRQS